MSVKIITADIFDAEIEVLTHAANCFNTMGAGIAKEIVKRHPEVQKADNKTNYGDIKKLGTILNVPIDEVGVKYGIVCNLYAQFSYGRGRMLNYEALYVCLTKSEEIHRGLIIGVPYGIGCGLAGGSWPVVEAMIRDIFEGSESEVLICKKP